MATIVMHRESETNFVLLGVGYGTWATDKPGMLGFSDRKSGTQTMVYVSDDNGKIGAFAAEDLVVVSVDGQDVRSVLYPPSEFPPIG